jgi:hypothetical protein
MLSQRHARPCSPTGMPSQAARLLPARALIACHHICPIGRRGRHAAHPARTMVSQQPTSPARWLPLSYAHVRRLPRQAIQSCAYRHLHCRHLAFACHHVVVIAPHQVKLSSATDCFCLSCSTRLHRVPLGCLLGRHSRPPLWSESAVASLSCLSAAIRRPQPIVQGLHPSTIFPLAVHSRRTSVQPILLAVSSHGRAQEHPKNWSARGMSGHESAGPPKGMCEGC